MKDALQTDISLLGVFPRGCVGTLATCQTQETGCGKVAV